MVIYEWKDAKYLGKVHHLDTDNELPVSFQPSGFMRYHIESSRKYTSVRELLSRKGIARVNNSDISFLTCRPENLRTKLASGPLSSNCLQLNLQRLGHWDISQAHGIIPPVLIHTLLSASTTPFGVVKHSTFPDEHQISFFIKNPYIIP